MLPREMLATFKNTIARILGFGQGDEGELIFAGLEDGRPGVEPPSRQEAAEKLLGYRQESNGGNMMGNVEGEDVGVQPPSGGEPAGGMGESQEAREQPASDKSALLSDEGAEDDAEGGLDLGSEAPEGSAGFGDLSLDIFESEKLVDEDEQDLPEGLVDIEVQNLLEECGDIAGRLAALPRHRAILPDKPENQT